MSSDHHVNMADKRLVLVVLLTLSFLSTASMGRGFVLTATNSPFLFAVSVASKASIAQGFAVAVILHVAINSAVLLLTLMFQVFVLITVILSLFCSYPIF